ncbi:TipAS antibiotic-recognition domain-containing protein [bacterium]|nr:TipAS antibiotic-recognition domain-containing protein [bacterium]
METKKTEQQIEYFSQEEYGEEAKIRFDPKIVKESQRRYNSWSKEKFAQIQAEAKRILEKLATIMERPISDREVQTLVREYHTYMENYYHVTSDIFMGLAEIYTTDDRFTAYFEKVKMGLADYLARAMQHYCNAEFKEIKQSA